MAEPLIVTMFTEKYEGAVSIFTIYMILLPTYSFRIGWILMASGQTKFLLRLTLVMSTVNVMLSYYLITELEGDNRLLGIPFATVFVTWLSTIAIMYQSIRTLESKFVDLYPWKRIISIIILSLLSGIPVFALTTINTIWFSLVMNEQFIHYSVTKTKLTPTQKLVYPTVQSVRTYLINT